jgi:hypothetical protein
MVPSLLPRWDKWDSNIGRDLKGIECELQDGVICKRSGLLILDLKCFGKELKLIFERLRHYECGLDKNKLHCAHTVTVSDVIRRIMIFRCNQWLLKPNLNTNVPAFQFIILKSKYSWKRKCIVVQIANQNITSYTLNYNLLSQYGQMQFASKS